jgi:diaminopimelate epimerase
MTGMRSLEFTKWTSFGNSFVLVDERTEPVLSETDKSRLAFRATNASYGVGADNLLVIQECATAVLERINRARGYWQETPDPSCADFVFRMFEPDGTEAFSCGNGLMSIAAHLRLHHGVPAARILTEVPCAKPRPVTIGYDAADGSGWTRLGPPRRIPDQLVAGAVRTPVTGEVERLNPLRIRLRRHDLAPYSDSAALDIRGYLVFTGEPHLVTFPGEVFPSEEMVETVFAAEGSSVRREFGSWLVQRIGWCINKEYPDIIPQGLNVNLVRVAAEGRAFEYRCFERGINRETLACGTGALAVAHVTRALGLWDGERCEVWPYGARRYDPTAVLRVHREGSGWVLRGRPRVLFRGVLPWESASDGPVAAQRRTAGRSGAGGRRAATSGDQSGDGRRRVVAISERSSG